MKQTGPCVTLCLALALSAAGGGCTAKFSRAVKRHGYLYYGSSFPQGILGHFRVDLDAGTLSEDTNDIPLLYQGAGVQISPGISPPFFPTNGLVWLPSSLTQSILVARINAATGGLIYADQGFADAAVTALAVDPSHRFMVGFNTVSTPVKAFSLDEAGTPVLINSQSLGGSFPVRAAFSSTGNFLFVATNSSGIVTLPFNTSTGSLSAFTSTSPLGGGTAIKIEAHPREQILIGAFNTSLTIQSMAINGSTGALTGVQSESISANISDFTLHPTLDSFYVLKQSSPGEIRAYSINTATGAFTYASTQVLSQVDVYRSMEISRDGRFLYAATDSAVEVFSVSEDGLELSAVQTLSASGRKDFLTFAAVLQEL
ncbi:MAG: lactonase family protein [Bacteriovoracia bacterium]